VMCRAAIWIALPACGTSWSPALGHSSSPQWRHLRIRLEPEPGRGLGAVSIFQDSNGLQHQMGLLRDAVPSLGAPALIMGGRTLVAATKPASFIPRTTIPLPRA